MPSENHLPARLELAQEQHIVDQLADLADLGPGVRHQLARLCARKLGCLEQDEQARERRAQLVRDRRGEPRAELLVARSSSPEWLLR